MATYKKKPKAVDLKPKSITEEELNERIEELNFPS